ncbi:glycosyltransferase family 2 protein [bacterium]|nr:MAG: glycosyltransferase family 2 protein [bacterium]
MNTKPLLSIVIASKNREQYCIEAIKSILSIPTNLIQITISDNSETDAIKRYVDNNPSEFLIYSYDNSAISSIENFNKAMQLATGDYVCMIGDDDTVLPNIIEIVNWMILNDVESVSCQKYINFIWPNKEILEFENGSLEIPSYTNNYTKIDVEKNLRALISNGIINYSIYNLPRVYHGIVKKEIMEKIHSETGHYFGGLTPDIYSTITLSCHIKKHFVIDYPFSIAGACPSSTSISSLSAGHSGLLEDAPHFKNRKEVYNWEKQIPRFYSVETIWAESGLKALNEINRNDLLGFFKIYKFAAYACIANARYFKKARFSRLIFLFVLSFSKSILIYKPLKINPVKHTFMFIGNIITTLLDIFFTKKKRHQQLEFTLSNIKSINEAVLNIDKIVFKGIKSRQC